MLPVLSHTYSSYAPVVCHFQHFYTEGSCLIMTRLFAITSELRISLMQNTRLDWEAHASCAQTHDSDVREGSVTGIVGVWLKAGNTPSQSQSRREWPHQGHFCCCCNTAC